MFFFTHTRRNAKKNNVNQFRFFAKSKNQSISEKSEGVVVVVNTLRRLVSTATQWASSLSFYKLIGSRQTAAQKQCVLFGWHETAAMLDAGRFFPRTMLTNDVIVTFM